MSELIPRAYKNLDTYLKPGKALIIFGPRQVGKTTLIQNYLKDTPYRYRIETGDDIEIRELLSTPRLSQLKEFTEGYELIVLDEAQKIPNIGETLKLIVDQIKSVRIVATGSSSFELAGQLGEPLTGRKTTLILYPIAQLELREIENPYNLKQKVKNFLIYGSYPEVISSQSTSEKRERVVELMHSYLLKDILELDKVKGAKVLLDLLRLLAFQIGKEVSLAELARTSRIDGKTVARYLDLLEKSFVLYNLRGYSRNLRKEVTRTSKYYFYDTGIRNAVISNFNDFELRNDIGELWENFIVIERLKKQAYQTIYANNYFWRTWDQQEIDFLEERDGQLFGYELKWQNNRKIKVPKDWLSTYPEAKFEIIDRENYLNFVT